MLPVFQTERATARDRDRLRVVLQECPWIWPWKSDKEAHSFAASVAGIESPPEPVVGRTVIVTNHESGSSVWLLGDSSINDLIVEPVEIAPTARNAWKEACAASSRSVAVLWASTRLVESSGFQVVRLGGLPRAGMAEPDLSIISGPSFGVSFLLSIVSRLFNVPVPIDVAASAAVSSDGCVSKVGELDRKIEGLVHVTPQVRRLLVSRDQVEVATRYANGRIAIVPVSTGAEAVTEVFGDLPRSVLNARVSDKGHLRVLVEELFRLATRGRGEVYDWAPVACAADVVAAADGLEPFDRYEAQLAGAISARHRDNGGIINLPPDGWLKSKPGPEQIGILATLVQHAADTDVLPVVEVERLARGLIGEIRDGNPTQLKLAGALGRLLAVTGRLPEAAVIQEQCAHAFLKMPENHNVCHPLSEWFRLSGVIGDPEIFRRAEAFRGLALQAGAIDDAGRPYVDFGRARAGVLLKNLAPAELQGTLERLASELGPSAIKWSAMRWAVKALRDLGNLPTAVALERLVRSVGDAPEIPARRAIVLAELDKAVSERRQEQAAKLVETLRILQPGPVGHLLSASRTSDHPPEYVAKAFPY